MQLVSRDLEHNDILLKIEAVKSQRKVREMEQARRDRFPNMAGVLPRRASASLIWQASCRAV